MIALGGVIVSDVYFGQFVLFLANNDCRELASSWEQRQILKMAVQQVFSSDIAQWLLYYTRSW